MPDGTLQWTELPVLVRRTADDLIVGSGVSLHRIGEPRAEGVSVVVPLGVPGTDTVTHEAVIARDGAGYLRAA